MLGNMQKGRNKDVFEDKVMKRWEVKSNSMKAVDFDRSLVDESCNNLKKRGQMGWPTE